MWYFERKWGQQSVTVKVGTNCKNVSYGFLTNLSLFPAHYFSNCTCTRKGKFYVSNVNRHLTAGFH